MIRLLYHWCESDVSFHFAVQIVSLVNIIRVKFELNLSRVNMMEKILTNFILSFTRDSSFYVVI